MDPNYTDFKFLQVKAHPWHKLFHTSMPPQAVGPVSRLLQYSPNLRYTTTWIPYKSSHTSNDVGQGSNARLFEKERNLYTIRAVPLTDVRSIRRHTPTLGWQYIIVVLSSVLAVTDSSWTNLVTGSETPVLVEFWAPWCGPCQMIAPVIDELAKEYAGKIACYKLNTDDYPAITTQYGVRSIPTVLVFKNGEKKESVIGAVPKSTWTATIEKYVGA